MQLPKSKAQINREKYAAQAALKVEQDKQRRKAASEARQSYRTRIADRIDGYNRDDLGLSPDC